MSTELNSLFFDGKIQNIIPYNPLFSKCKIIVMYTGKNRNNSVISKDVVEAALPTLFNIPIVGEYIEHKDNFGGHGGKIEIVDDEINFLRTTVPMGIVPESAAVSWQNIEEDDGTINEYLVVDNALLWTGRYPELSLFDDYVFNQSMEISEIVGGFNKDKVYEIESFVFSALCILGSDKNGESPEDHVEPAFESAAIQTYSLESFKLQFNQMIAELKFSLKKDEESNFEEKKSKAIEIDNTKDSAVMSDTWSNPGSGLWNKLLEASNAESLVKEAYLIVDEDWKDAPSEALHYPHHEIKDEKLVVNKQGVESAYSRLMQNDPNNEEAIKHIKKHYKELGLDMSNFEIDEGGNKMAKKDKQEFALSSEQLENELKALIVNIEDEDIEVDSWWGDCQQFFYVDHYVDEKIVVVRDLMGRLFGYSFEIEGDKITIDTTTQTRYKYDLVPMDLGTANPESEIDEMLISNDEFSEKVIEYAKEKAKQMAEDEMKKKDEEADAEMAKKLEEKEKQMADMEEDYKAKVKEMEDDSEEMAKKAMEAEEEMAKKDEELKAEKAKNSSLQEEIFSMKAAEREKAVSTLFSSFASQLSEEDMVSIKESASAMTLEQIEDKLFALVGKKTAQFSFDSKTVPFKMPVYPNDDSKKDDGPAWQYLMKK